MPKSKVIGHCLKCKLVLCVKDIRRIDLEDSIYKYILCPRCWYRLPFNEGGRMLENGKA